MKLINKLIVLLVMGMFITSCGGNSEEDAAYERALAAEDAKIAAHEAKQDSIAAAKKAMEFKWQYSREEDAMGNVNATARVKSLNTISLPFPYNDTDYGYLVVRNHTDYGKDIYFFVKEGQIQNDKVTVRFDEEKAYDVSYNEPSDGSSELIFLRGYSSLIKKLQNSKKLAMQVTFYDAGNHIFEFDVSDLDMSRLK